MPLNEGDLEAAAGFFASANKLYAARPEAYLQLGSVYSRLGRADESAEAFQAARTMLDESREMAMADTLLAATWQEHYDIATLGLGQALQLSEQWPEAADLYGQMLADDPDNPSIIGSLASVLTEMNMPDSVGRPLRQPLEPAWPHRIRLFERWRRTV